jgi:hypothetical protein
LSLENKAAMPTVCVFAVLGREPKASHMLGKRSPLGYILGHASTHINKSPTASYYFG